MDSIKLHVLDNRVDTGMVTFGLPWEKSKNTGNKSYRLIDSQGNYLPLQSRITAYWPDGTVKWTAHTGKINGQGPYELDVISDDLKGEMGIEGIKVISDNGKVTVDAGSTKAVFQTGSDHVIDQVFIDGRLAANFGQLKYISEERSVHGHKRVLTEQDYYGRVDKITVEEQGELQCTIRIEGIHKSKVDDRELIPFILRFTFAWNEPYIKILHTFLYDGQANKDFMKAIGITFNCPIEGELYNRHIKFAGENGVFHEASQLLLSWRPRLPEHIYPMQNQGHILSKDEMSDPLIVQAIQDITIWDSYRLYQNSSRHYSIKKSTDKEDICFIDSLQGGRAGGIMAVAGEEGGVAIGMRDFWQKYPSSLWVENMSRDTMKVTAWIWSYEHEAMDFRHYDTVGHASAYYEGFDEVGSTPYGIASTNELTIFGFNGGIPSDDNIKEYERQVQKPPVLAAEPGYYHKVKAFGEWSLVNRSTTFTQWLEDQLDAAFNFYDKEIEQRDWYGLFNYGDFMHTYDAQRHNWRYDMGGYAWQNTELVPTLWLWYAYMRTGREDIFTVAEAMTRHCSEVDIYHLGDLKGLGSRHNVLHWGCSCKEARISMAGHHRFYYYMMGDYRLGDVFDDVEDADFSTVNMDPLRHFYDKNEMVYPTHARTGPDWSSFVSNWMTAWERKQDNSYRDKILTGIKDIKKAPYRLISGSNYEYDPESGHLRYIGENSGGGSHLAICMGGPQVWFELADMLEDSEWEKMLAEYGDFYFASKEEKAARAPMVASNKGFAFPYMAAAMGAYAARYYKNKELANKIWNILKDELSRGSQGKGFEPDIVSDYVNTEQLYEIPWLSTNFTAQWCLNVIMCLELIKDYIPED